jgi:regulator of protease activity HflC (stomatin/prohibitin superfamily)
MFAILGPLAVLFLLVLYITYRVIKFMKPRRIVLFDYQRGVSYRHGSFEAILGPGIYWQTVTRTIVTVDTRLQMLTLQAQEILTSDGLAVKLTSVVSYFISDPARMISASDSVYTQLYAEAQLALRAAVAELPFDGLLIGRTAIAEQMLAQLQPFAESLGLTVTSARVNDIMLPADIRRAYALAVTAQKEGIAALERARGETAALRALANAARLMQDHPGLMQLRALQTLDNTKGNATLELRFDNAPEAPPASKSA